MKRHRIIIQFLSKLIEKEIAEEKINQAIQKEIDEKRHRKERENSKSVVQQETDEIIYIETLSILESTITEATSESIKLEQELIELNAQLDELEKRYHKYRISLDEIELTDLSAPLFQQQVTKIESQMSSYAQITMLLEQGKEKEAYEQQEINYTLNLKLEMLRQMKTMQQQERYFVNQIGERVSLAKDAAFFVPNNKQLTFDKGEYYLHPHAKPFDTMSPAERLEARAMYTQTMRDMMSIKMMLQTNRTQEISLLEQKKNSISARSEALKHELVSLTELKNKALEMRQAHQQQALHQHQATPTPRPLPALKKPDINHHNRPFNASELQKFLEMQLRNGTATSKQVVEAQNIRPSTLPSPFNTRPKP